MMKKTVKSDIGIVLRHEEARREKSRDSLRRLGQTILDALEITFWTLTQYIIMGLVVSIAMVSGAAFALDDSSSVWKIIMLVDFMVFFLAMPWFIGLYQNIKKVTDRIEKTSKAEKRSRR